MALLLDEFEKLFKGRRYNHRVSTHGDRLARLFYEDLYSLESSATFNDRGDRRSCLVSTNNKVTGKTSRRGDGTFGEALPHGQVTVEPGYNVAIGQTANLQIGVEVKILAKAMLKQIDRVINDLRNQAAQFRAVTEPAITIGVVGVNHAERYVSYEGGRPYTAEGREAPSREATKAADRLVREVAPSYDEFLVIPFQATNEGSYPFTWNKLSSTQNELSAALLRTLRLYEERF